MAEAIITLAKFDSKKNQECTETTLSREFELLDYWAQRMCYQEMIMIW